MEATAQGRRWVGEGREGGGGCEEGSELQVRSTADGTTKALK